eukprot:3597636-Amphidinium_carterae.1
MSPLGDLAKRMGPLASLSSSHVPATAAVPASSCGAPLATLGHLVVSGCGGALVRPDVVLAS